MVKKTASAGSMIDYKGDSRLDARGSVLGTRYWVLGSEYSVLALGTGYWVLGTEYRVPGLSRLPRSHGGLYAWFFPDRSNPPATPASGMPPCRWSWIRSHRGPAVPCFSRVSRIGTYPWRI